MSKEILVVDDTPEMIDVVQAVLESEGYKVDGANGGKECLEKLKKKRPDLILLDLKMPGMDGWDVLREIRKNKETKSIPVMMYTTVDKNPDEDMLKERGVDDYIQKPFDMENLVLKVERLTKNK